MTRTAPDASLYCIRTPVSRVILRYRLSVLPLSVRSSVGGSRYWMLRSGDTVLSVSQRLSLNTPRFANGDPAGPTLKAGVPLGPSTKLVTNCGSGAPGSRFGFAGRVSSRMLTVTGAIEL